MIVWKKYILLEIICNVVVLSTGQWCGKYGPVMRTRVKWNNGERMVSKRNFFGGIKYKYEPYVYSTIQYENIYEYTAVCCAGYRKISDTYCKAICQPDCPTNTYCIRPNECACNDGYKGYAAAASLIKCSPVCDNPACPENAQCTKPNTCQCAEGYEDEWGSCEPICSKKCSEFSHCTKPNECSCFKGYLDNGLGSCQPVCLKGCPENAVCTKPETCTCHDGYEMIDDECQPICQSKCPENSSCVKPNQCECLKGFASIEQDPSSMECLPKCEQNCSINSYCHKPNKCLCNVGYSQTELGLCNPICLPKCPEYSVCLVPNKCSCLTGYEMSDNHCQPICTKACPEKAFCKTPNKCECEPGYQLKLTSNHNLYCEPICQSNCSTFGKCVTPNKCECLEGYDVDEMEICQPVCSQGCQNGLCYKPNVCVCNSGYLMGPHEQCEPTCSFHCHNGSCVEPEICHCHKGFRLKKQSINICEPICEPECKNGICAGPNVCICHENYEPLTTEFGLNHNDCQIIATTTEYYSTSPDDTSTTSNELELDGTSSTSQLLGHESTTTSDADLLMVSVSTAKTHALEPAEVCSAMCQCWQEYDEFGPLISEKCTNVCLDDHDKPCLNLTLCQCDIAKTQLICRDNSMELDDPLMFMCKIQRYHVTTSKSIDMKSIGESKNSILPWVMIVCLAVFASIAIVAGLIFYRFRQPGVAILEYEL